MAIHVGIGWSLEKKVNSKKRKNTLNFHIVRKFVVTHAHFVKKKWFKQK